LYYTDWVAEDRFDPDLLNDEDPFEIDAQAAHLFKHPRLGIEEYAFYAQAENQEPQGLPRRRAGLTATVPVRFAPERLDEIRRRAAAEDRSVSSWIRRAVEHELHPAD
jgi:hypothetical protein